jgi:hypothetical protein
MSKKRDKDEEDRESDNGGFGPGFMESRDFLLDDDHDTAMGGQRAGAGGGPKKKKLKPVKFDKLTEKYGHAEDCPLCNIGLYTFATRDIETQIGNLLKRTVFFVSRAAIVKNIGELLEDHRSQQIAAIERGESGITLLPEITSQQIMTHLSECMTEYSWELRTQIDDLRSVISMLKDKIIQEDPETGLELVNAKNVQLLQVSQANLRKVLIADINKSLSFKPEVTYTKGAQPT